MNKKLYSVALVAIPMLVLAVGGCQSNSYSPQTPGVTPAPSSQSQTTTTPSANQTGSAVTIKNFAFSPADLTIAKGTAVTWTNEDSVSHQIASDSSAFSGNPISQGQNYSFTFNETGIFPYHCAIHPSMKGTITVK